MTPTPTILVATWSDGLFRVVGESVHHEVAGQSVRGLTSDGHGGALAIVGGHSLCRRSAEGEWITLAESDHDLSCCVAVEDVVFVGTDDARVLRVDPDGGQQWLTGFDAVEGRDRWYAGAAVVDGKLMGPPLGVRSMTATCDGGALLANVHVGGVPRSTDGGRTWRPTIDIDSDVHQVLAHPTRPELVIAAAAAGLCVSRDAGASWSIEHQGLHAPHCSAVAFVGEDIFVSASTDPFSEEGAVYRRPIEAEGPLEPAGMGLPRWTDGVVDTDCIATRGSVLAVIDGSARLYVSDGAGAWSVALDRGVVPIGLHIC